MSAPLEETYGRGSVDRRETATSPDVQGARAALESFYHAFNTRSLEALRDVWADDERVRLSNPLGGIVEGLDGVTALYRRIFEGPADVWVEFHDIVEYRLAPTAVVYAGRERGVFRRGEVAVDLDIRTSRVFGYDGRRWGQVHHHGSITQTDVLDRYRAAVTGE